MLDLGLSKAELLLFTVCAFVTLLVTGMNISHFNRIMDWIDVYKYTANTCQASLF